MPPQQRQEVVDHDNDHVQLFNSENRMRRVDSEASEMSEMNMGSDARPVYRLRRSRLIGYVNIHTKVYYLLSDAFDETGVTSSDTGVNI